MPVAQCLICGALPGQTVVIRYPRLRNMALNQIDEAIEAEAGQNIPYDLAEVFLDWSLLEEEGEDDDKQLKVLLVAAKHEVIDSRVQIADEAGIQYGVLSVDSLALADAAEGCDFLQVGETVALINIGASSVSIHFTRDGISNFIRDVSWGARELIQAIAKSRRCDYDEAERMLYNAEEELAKAPAEPEPVAPEPAAAPDPFADSGGGSDELGSLLDPLDGELDALGGDALGGDALGGDPEPAAPVSNEFGMGDISMTTGGAEATMSEILAMPITRLVSEVRRSFDYYEHQLYERPVDRIILSGGVAHLPVLRDAFMDDLGVENVEVANPTSGSLGVSGNVAVEFEQHPAQFMVAVGLAARGAADL
jgi:type IV pilus assembly protein PilM